MFDIGNNRCAGVFFEIYREPDVFVPHLRYFDRTQTGDSPGSYLNHFIFTQYNKNTITISCEKASVGIMDCKYPHEDGYEGFKTQRVMLPESWDSLFIGTRIPYESEILLTILEVDVR